MPGCRHSATPPSPPWTPASRAAQYPFPVLRGSGSAHSATVRPRTGLRPARERGTGGLQQQKQQGGQGGSSWRITSGFWYFPVGAADEKDSEMHQGRGHLLDPVLQAFLQNGCRPAGQAGALPVDRRKLSRPSLWIKEPLGRAAKIPLFTEPACKVSPDKCIAGKPEQEEDNDREQDRQGKFQCKEGNPRHDRDQEYEEVRHNILPGECNLRKPFLVSFPEEECADAALAKSAGPAEIITVPAMPAHEPDFEGKNKEEIEQGPGKPDPGEDERTRDPDYERHEV